MRIRRLLKNNSGLRTPVKLVGRIAQQRLGNNYPLCASVFVTKRCNVRCDGCVYYANQDDEVEKRKEETQEMIFLLQRLADQGVPVVALVGGEPFLRKDLGSIIRAGARMGLSMSVITNAMKLHDDGMVAVDAHCDSISFSPHPPSELQGPAEAGARRYELGWEGFGTLRRRIHNAELVCAITLGRHTADRLDRMIQRALDAGADAIKYTPNFFPSQFPSPRQLQSITGTLRKWTAARPDKFQPANIFLNDLESYFGATPKIDCTAQRHFNLGVFPDGTVSACCAELVPMGNLLREPLSAMLDRELTPKSDCHGCHRIDVVQALRLCGE